MSGKYIIQQTNLVVGFRGGEIVMEEKMDQSLMGGLVAKSCPTLATPWTIARQVSSVHGIFQARILEWVADLVIKPGSLAMEA